MKKSLRKKPPVPKNNISLKRTNHPLIPPKSVFSSEDEENPIPNSSENLSIKNISEKLNEVKEFYIDEELDDLSSNPNKLNVSTFEAVISDTGASLLEKWAKKSPKLTKEVTDIIATTLSFLDCVVKVQTTLISEGIDPNSEILTDTLSRDIELLVHNRLLLAAAKSLYSDEDSEYMDLVLKLISEANPKKSSNPMKKILESINKSSLPKDESPYGEPVGSRLGTVKKYDD